VAEGVGTAGVEVARGDARDGEVGFAPAARRRTVRLRPQKIAAQLAQRIVQDISDRSLRKGDRLPSEREMLAEYGVGRGTLREALRYLEIQGLITLKPGPGGGPAVNVPDARFFAGTFALVLQFSRTPFRVILETRAVLEPAVAAIAAQRIDAQQIGELRASLKTMKAALGDEQAFLEENEHFHELIAWASGNPLLHYVLSSLNWIADGTVMGVQYPEWSRRIVMKLHTGIVDALEDGNPELAAERMRAHLRHYSTYLERHYPTLLERVVRWDRVGF
jgi:DNA-binding FadR family transcriptional regulator